MPSRLAFERFLKYAFIGTSTSLLDIYLLWILTTHLDIYYLTSAGFTFILAATLDYAADRHFVFSNTKRKPKSGYLYFLTILGAGLVMTLTAMLILVEFFSINYIIARIFIAGAVGIWSYLMNLYINFRVAGKY